MRWSPLFCLFLLLPLLPARAGEPDQTAAEYLKAARIAMEAKLAEGDLLRQKGDLEGALKAYKEASRLFEEAKRRLAARRAPRSEAEVPSEEIVETPIPAPARVPLGRPVEAALRWLAAHQDVMEDGKWDCDGFMKHDPKGDKSDGPGGALFDVGVTSLSLLAFLGAGYTDRGTKEQNPYGRNVRMGLRYLMISQSDEGIFGTRSTHSYIYNHALATLAVCEAYARTRNPRYKAPAQKGLDFIARARNPYLAWRYDARSGENDTSVTSWCVLALRSGRFAGLEVDDDAFQGALSWIDKMTDPNFGQVGYNYPGGISARPEGLQDKFPPSKSQAMTAAGIVVRMIGGQKPANSAVIQKGLKLCLQTPPKWNREDGSIDMYYWFFGTLAAFQAGGTYWQRWSAAMKPAMVASQDRALAARGSWDPAGAWGNEGGRIYSTAMMALCLEVYYRYARALGVR